MPVPSSSSDRDTKEKLPNLSLWIHAKRTASRFTKPFVEPASVVRWVRHKYRHYRFDRRFRRDFLNDDSKAGSILLASYPKSGNTYLRFIFANIISIKELDGQVVDYHLLDEMLPTDLFEADLKEPWEYRTLPCILKTHRSYRDVFEPLGAIYLYRNPLDVMVSNYHYFKNRSAPPPYASTGTTQDVDRSPFTGTPTNYLREHIQGWCQHFRSWYNVADVRVSYEELKASPTSTARRILRDLEIAVERDVLEQAVERSAFERVKELERDRGTSKKMANLEGEFARSGKIGQWTSYFDEDDVDVARECMKEYGLMLSDFTLETK